MARTSAVGWTAAGSPILFRENTGFLDRAINVAVPARLGAEQAKKVHPVKSYPTGGPSSSVDTSALFSHGTAPTGLSPEELKAERKRAAAFLMTKGYTPQAAMGN